MASGNFYGVGSRPSGKQLIRESAGHILHRLLFMVREVRRLEQDFAYQKNRPLRVLLSNCTLQNGTLQPQYKESFDILARSIEGRQWGE